jgi:hypothetical protein
VACKRQKLQDGGLDIGFETALSAPGRTMQACATLKNPDFLIQPFKNDLYSLYFFFQCHDHYNFEKIFESSLFEIPGTFLCAAYPNMGIQPARCGKSSSEKFYGNGFWIQPGSPAGAMKHNIRNGHGFFANYFIVPRNSRLLFGVGFRHTLHGYDKIRQEYAFNDGSVAPTYI